MDNQSFYQQKEPAREYDKDRFGNSFGRFLEHREVEIYLSLLKNHSGRVLDVGAGTGKLSLPLLEKKIDVVSVDSSEAMLEIASEKAKENMRLQGIVCDIHNLPFPDNAFESVICSRVLMHLADWRKGIAELCRVASHFVVLDFPPTRSLSGLGGLLSRVQSFLGIKIPPHRVFDIQSVIREFHNHNYHVTLASKDFFLPIVFHRLLNRPRLSSIIENVFKTIGLVALFGAPVTMKTISNDGK